MPKRTNRCPTCEHEWHGAGGCETEVMGDVPCNCIDDSPPPAAPRGKRDHTMDHERCCDDIEPAQPQGAGGFEEAPLDFDAELRNLEGAARYDGKMQSSRSTRLTTEQRERVRAAHRAALNAASPDHDWRRQMEAYGYDSVTAVGKMIDAARAAGVAEGRRGMARWIRREMIRCAVEVNGRIDGQHWKSWLINLESEAGEEKHD